MLRIRCRNACLNSSALLLASESNPKTISILCEMFENNLFSLSSVVFGNWGLLEFERMISDVSIDFDIMLRGNDFRASFS